MQNVILYQTIAANGLRSDQVSFPDKALLFVIRRYTKAGVGTLKRDCYTGKKISKGNMESRVKRTNSS